VKDKLHNIQNQLLNLGGELSVPKKDLRLISAAAVSAIEIDIQKLNKNLQPLKEFVIPGEDEFSARLHVARSVCRKVETRVTELFEQKIGKQIWITYLNRLSDYLFVLSRYHTNQIGISEKQWNRTE